MCAALAAVVEESRVPPPGARVARAVDSPHPRGRTPSGLERKEGIVFRKLNFFALVVVAVAVTVARPAGAQSGGLCQLAGTAGISPGLSDTDSNFTFTFSGALSGCQSNDPSAPAAGTATVGQRITVGGVVAQEPAATGSGSCATSNGAGIAIVAWADGTTTVVSFTTQTVTGGVNLQGTVIPSVTLPVVGGGTVTVTTTRFAGDQAQGVLAFQADPTQCAGSGVTSAAVNGVVGAGQVQ